MLLIVLFAIQLATMAGVLAHGRAWSLKRGLMIGEYFVGRLSRSVDPSLPVETPVGYDSQFFWALALDPWMQDPEVARALDSPAYRYQRIGLPVMVWLIPGDASSVPYRLFAVNLLGWVLGLLALLKLAQEDGVSRLWTGVFYLTNGGLWMTLVHPMADLCAVTWTLCAFWLWRRQRHALAAVALACGTLTKETTVLVSAFLALGSALRPGRLGREHLWLVLSVLPGAMWQYTVAKHFGVWPFEQSQGNFDLPYVGIAKVFVQALERGDGLPSAWVAAGLGLLCLATILRVRWPATPLEAMLWGHAVFLSFAGTAILHYAGNALRIAAPFTVLLPLLLLRTHDPVRGDADTGRH